MYQLAIVLFCALSWLIYALVFEWCGSPVVGICSAMAVQFWAMWFVFKSKPKLFHPRHSDWINTRQLYRFVKRNALIKMLFRNLNM